MGAGYNCREMATLIHCAGTAIGVLVPKNLLGSDRDFAVVRREDGVIELQAIDPSQAWFWTDRWQAKEAAAEQDIQNGNVVHFDSVEQLMASLINVRRVDRLVKVACGIVSIFGFALGFLVTSLVAEYPDIVKKKSQGF